MEKKRIDKSKILSRSKKSPRAMEKFLNLMDQKISRIEKKRLKGIRASSDTIFGLNLLIGASGFLITNPRYSQTLNKKHDWLCVRLVRFSHLGRN